MNRWYTCTMHTGLAGWLVGRLACCLRTIVAALHAVPMYFDNGRSIRRHLCVWERVFIIIHMNVHCAQCALHHARALIISSVCITNAPFDSSLVCSLEIKPRFAIGTCFNIKFMFLCETNIHKDTLIQCLFMTARLQTMANIDSGSCSSSDGGGGTELQVHILFSGRMVWFVRLVGVTTLWLQSAWFLFRRPRRYRRRCRGNCNYCCIFLFASSTHYALKINKWFSR